MNSRIKSVLMRWPVLAVLIMLSIFTLTRLGLAAYEGFSSVPAVLWPGMLLKGFGFDLAAIMLLVGPFCLYEGLTPDKWRAGTWHWRLWLFIFWAASAFLLFVAAAEVTFWLEFSTRFNFIAVDYLLYTHEVIGNIVQSYPIGWIFSGIGLAAALTVWLLLPAMRVARAQRSSGRARALCLCLGFFLPLAGYQFTKMDITGGPGNAYAVELAANGVLTFFSALKNNELDYDKFYRTMPQAEADEVLKGMQVARAPLSVAVKTGMDNSAQDTVPFLRRPRNVVLITVESLSASFLGSYGGEKGLTPNLDRMAREGFKFERVFATGTRTVRGLEALSLGIPPIPGQSVLRRPGNARLSTLGELLRRQGYETFFIYGGYGYFDNMNGYFRANDYKIVDRGDFPDKSVVFENVWGVADEVLFNNAIETIDREAGHKPFLAHIMTTSNHRPYTYPDGRIDLPSPGGRAGAVKYTDYAIGKFIADSAAKPWFKDTLFVVAADHCASVAGKTKLPLDKYSIPVIFYAPGLVKPGTYKPVISQIDVAPTILEVLGKKGSGYFFGRSAFAQGINPGRAFASNYQVLGYLRRDILTVLLPKRKAESYRVDPVTYAQTPAPVDPQLLREAIAYYQTAAKAFKTGAMVLK